MLDPDKLYSPREAAAIIKVHPETIRRWVREGRIGAQKGLRGQVYKVKGADVMREVERLRMEKPA